MKSSVTNDVLPIPREIYFSGSGRLNRKWYFEIFFSSPSSSNISHNRLPNDSRLQTSTFQKTMGVEFLYGGLLLFIARWCAFVFSWKKGKKPQKSQFQSSHCRNQNTKFKTIFSRCLFEVIELSYELFFWQIIEQEIGKFVWRRPAKDIECLRLSAQFHLIFFLSCCRFNGFCVFCNFFLIFLHFISLFL